MVPAGSASASTVCSMSGRRFSLTFRGLVGSRYCSICSGVMASRRSVVSRPGRWRRIFSAMSWSINSPAGSKSPRYSSTTGLPISSISGGLVDKRFGREAAGRIQAHAELGACPHDHSGEAPRLTPDLHVRSAVVPFVGPVQPDGARQ